MYRVILRLRAHLNKGLGVQFSTNLGGLLQARHGDHMADHVKETNVVVRPVQLDSELVCDQRFKIDALFGRKSWERR